MNKLLVAILTMACFTASAFAETYPKIIYSGGHPELQAEKVKGTLNVLTDHVEFTTEGSQAAIKMPYETISKVSEAHVVGGRPYLKTTAWVGGLVLAPLTFGASLIPAVGMTGLKTNGWYVSIEYTDEVALAHAVNFMVKNKAEQLKIKGDIENKVYSYRKALKEAKEKEASVTEPPNSQPTQMQSPVSEQKASALPSSSASTVTTAATDEHAKK